MKNKFTTYLLYAIGEITLVIVGILIAVQIDDWNNELEEKKQLKEYIKAINENVKTDLVQLEIDLEKRKKLKEANQLAKQQFINDSIDIMVFHHAQKFFYEFYFTPNKSGYDALKNSSYLGKLTNTRLDSLLQNYYLGLDNLHENEISFNTFIENIELQYRTQFPALQINNIITKDIKGEVLTPQETSLIISSYKSYIFQAGVHRAAATGTKNYENIISTGKELITEINQFIEN